jgi:hypothetical protein
VFVKDYNFRAYVDRRVKIGFRTNSVMAVEEARVAFEKGVEELELVRRQAIISQLYPSRKSVMESPRE